MSALSKRLILLSIRFSSLRPSTRSKVISLLRCNDYLNTLTVVSQKNYLVTKGNSSVSNACNQEVGQISSGEEGISTLHIKRTRTEKVVTKYAPCEDSPYPGSWSDKTHICTFCGKSFFSAKGLNIHITKVHSPAIIKELRKDPNFTYKAIFGEDNFKGINGSEMDFKNALTVSLKGPYVGMWKCWSDGTYGGPLKAIMRSNPEMSYSAVAELGAQIAGLSNAELRSSKLKNAALDNNETELKSTVQNGDDCVEQLSKIEKQRTLVAQSIWDKSVDLKGTLGETYLVEHRHIPPGVIARLEFKFLPHRTMWETLSYTDYDEHGIPYKVENVTPSLVVPVKNGIGEISGIQRIFLDKKTGGKPKFKRNHKFSKGVVHGGAGVVQKGELGQIVFVVEGPETGASIAAVVGKKCPVLASLSIGNFKSMTDVILSYRPRKVILAADNDGAKENVKNILTEHFVQLKKSISARNSNIDMKLIMPELVHVSHEKQASSDWNDVLVLEGIEFLEEQLWRKVNEQ